MHQSKLNPGFIVKTFLAQADRPSLDVVASVEIEADTRRVLYALAMPEYMEAWLQLPDTDRIECHPDQLSFDRFRIDLFSLCQRRGCIYGSCLLSRPDKITYLWERDRSGNRANSVVEITLRGGCYRCILKLKHSGFSNSLETEWHSAMWNRSLVKLSNLMKGTATGG